MWIINEEKNLIVDISKAFAIEILKTKDSKNFYVAAYFEVTESGQYNQNLPKQIILKGFEKEEGAKDYLGFLHKKLLED